MDVGKLMKNVKNLNNYVEITQDTSEKSKTAKIQLNMSTVLALKKIRSFEIEYFIKYEENGIACLLVERMLCLPPSKTWGVLGKELVTLLQYWLDGIRKHLVKRSIQWWTFLKLLMGYIKEMRQKDGSLPNLLVEHTAECLLDLATLDKPDVTQKYEILHCFNLYCSDASREIRFALRTKFGQYFTKLAHYISSCGHLPTQYSILETLLRWLIPRHDSTLRVLSASKWFPTRLFKEDTANLFLERPWVNFFQDARDFLNSHNTNTDLITSIPCRRLSIGKVIIISGTERQQSWLDINVTTKCLSVLLDPKVLETFGVTNHKAFETLIITQDNTETANFNRESHELHVSLHTINPPKAHPSLISLGNECDVTIVVTSHCDVSKLDVALRSVFGDKYQLLMDIEQELTLSPVPSASKTNIDEEVRFSHPVSVKRRKHSGYAVKQHSSRCMSPSTASTSSLLQLHDKLQALPKYRFDKEVFSVCVRPDLSIVPEEDDRSSLNTTLLVRNKPYGIVYKSLFKADKPESDPENKGIVGKEKVNDRKSQSDPESSKNKIRGLSPVDNVHETSCLLVATIGSADDSVINETVEKFAKQKDFYPENIVDLLVKEALGTNERDNDSGINTGEKRIENLDNSEAIENTPNSELNLNKNKRAKSKVISSTSDESNTEAISDTPSCYVNTRKKRENIEPTAKTFDVQVVEQFFSQHFTENAARETIISPTLAKKINETSSETSDHFGDEYNLLDADMRDIEPADFNNIEVLQCLNNMVDKVCIEFEKCTKYFDDSKTEKEENLPLQDILNTIQEMETNIEADKEQVKETNAIKLKYKIKTPRKKKSRLPKKKDVKTAKMSTIIEDNIEELAETPQEEINTVVETEKEVIQEEPDKIITLKEVIQNKPNKTISLKKVIQDEPNEIITVKEVIHNEPNEIIIVKEIIPDELNEIIPDIEPEKRSDSKTPILSRKKRKLYSPKDDEIETVKDPSESDNINKPEDKTISTPNAKSTPYKDIERDRQKNIRTLRTKRTKKTEVSSPRTKKLNDIFDKVKDSANSEQVRLADKTFEIDVYNFSSDTDDDFRQKKFEVQKNSTAKSTTTKRGRVVKVPKYSDYMSSDDARPKPKVTRRTRSKKKIIEVEDKVNLIDERMREAREDLNTSIIVEENKKVTEEPQLVLEEAPKMETIEDTVEVKPKPKRKVRKAKVPPRNPKQVLEIDDGTLSPLPGLVVETIEVNKDKDLSPKMLDKFKKIYRDGPEKYINESNTTQNLLSDVERINSPRINITDDLELLEEPIKIDKNINKRAKNNTKQVKIKKEKTSIVNIRESVINLCDTTEAKSEKSIATEGITAHIDFEEAPPSPNLIAERFEPRNLELQDLDNSMQDYFTKLTDQLHRTSGNSDKDKSKTGSEKSVPIVSVARLSLDDISRWLPSRRNSDSDGSSVKSKEISEKPANVVDKDKNISEIDIIRSSQSKRNSSEFYRLLQLSPVKKSSSNSKEIVSSLNKNDSDSVGNRKSARLLTKSKENTKNTQVETSDSSDNETTQKPKLITKKNNSHRKSSVNYNFDSDYSETKPKTKTKIINSQRKSSVSHNSDSDYGENKQKPKLITNKKNSQKKASVYNSSDSDNNENKHKTKIMTKKNNSQRKTSINYNSDSDVSDKNTKTKTKNITKNLEPTKTKFKSCITPIELFDDLISNADKKSQSTLSEDEEFMKGIIETFKKKKDSENRKEKDIQTKKIQKEKAMSTSPIDTQIAKPEKRKIEEVISAVKRQKTELSVADIASGTTVSSVDDWFRRNAPTNTREMLHMTISDSIQHVMEKLDTTLIEINQNTSKKFVHLFVDTQQHLTRLKEDRCAMFKRTATDILANVVKIMDEKFADLDKRSQEQDHVFMKQLKEGAAKLIREDCEQKRVMVRLLKEDIDAVQLHTNNLD